MPAHLSKEQKNLIYKTKYENFLLTEPVTATISGENFTLQTLRRLPSANKGLFTAIKLMKKNKKDWDNLPNLLQGLKNAGLDTKKLLIKKKILIRATSAGRQEVVLECLRRVADTGDRLMAGADSAG